MKAPQQGLQHVQEGAGDRPAVFWRGWRFRALQDRT